MRKDEVNRQKEIDPVFVIPRRAACRHCGQIMAIESILDWGPKEEEELATELCSCDGAMAETKREKNRELAKDKIEQLFTDPEFTYHLDEIMDPEIREQLLPCLNGVIDAVTNGVLNGCTCDIEKGIKAVVKRKSNGAIRIQRIVKNDTSFSI